MKTCNFDSIDCHDNRERCLSQKEVIIMKLQQVSDNCFAVLNEKNRVCDANSGLINLGGGVVIDTQSDLAHAQQMIDRKAVELRPQDPNYAYTLAFYLNRKGNRDEAGRTLKTLLEKYPGHKDAEMLLNAILKKEKSP
jgi:ferritin-like metal-binding protein YciE